MMEQQAEEAQQDSCMDAEVLKMKLQRGPEKLLQWNVQQEHALSNMKKKLDKSVEVRDRMKNILEMQLDHNSRALMEKVQHTRSVYSILDEHLQGNSLEALVEKHQEVYKTALEKAKAFSHDLEQNLQEARHLISLKNDSCSELENQLSLSSKSFMDTISKKHKTISQLQQMQSLATKLTEKTNIVLKLKADKNALLDRISEAESLLGKEVEHKDQLLKELAAAYSDKQKLQLDAEDKFSRIENEWKERMTSELQKVKKEMDHAQNNLKAQCSQSMKLEEEKYAKLLAEINLDTQKKIDEIKKENNEVMEIKAKLENSLREKEEMNQMVLEQKNRLETEIHEKDDLVSKLQESLNSSEKGSEEIVNKLTNEIEEVEAKRIKSLKEMLKEVFENYLKDKNETSKNMEKITVLEKNLKAKDNIINDLKRKLKNTESMLTEATSQKEILKDIIENCLKNKNETSENMEKITLLKKNVNDKVNIINDLKRKLKNTESMLTEATSQKKIFPVNTVAQEFN